MARRTQKALLWAFWAANLLIVIGFWASVSGAQLIGGQIDPFIAFGRLAGLLATFCALTQFVLMGRAGWLEPVFGMDRIARAHRVNGYAAISLMLAHGPLLAIGYGVLTGNSFFAQMLDFELNYPYVIWAAIALLLFVTMVGLSIYIVRKHLKFETWYFVHLLAYLAIALIPFHQLTNGGDFAGNAAFGLYWIGLYAFTLLTVVIWRIGRPLYRSLFFRFRVEKVIPEAPRATSVYITGRNLPHFKGKGGQFVLVRFLAKGMWWQEHPFSLSMLPTKDHFRLTIRQLGDFTNMIPDLQPGTKVMISGPHGAFTADLAITNKRLYIAGGVGITPIRALIEEQAATQKPQDAVLLFGNRLESEIIFREELDELGVTLNMPIHHVISDDPAWKGETGFIDQAKLARLVPDITSRDIFLCGPPAMMAGVIASLKALSVPADHIHYERFELHKN